MAAADPSAFGGQHAEEFVAMGDGQWAVGGVPLHRIGRESGLTIVTEGNGG